MSNLLRAWYLFLGLGLLTFVFTAFVGQIPYALSSAIAPPNQLFTRVGVSFRDTATSLLDRRNLRSETAELQLRLRESQDRARLLEVELERLEQLLRVRKTQTPAAVMTVPVTQVSPSSLLRRVSLGRGVQSGVKPNMPVTAPGGLVGIVTEVSARSAVARAITDPESAVGVRLREAGGQGVAVGIPGGLVRVEDFRIEGGVALGDMVETSSRGGLFPRGITVGTVIEVPPPNPNDLRMSFIVKPAVDPTMLTDVTLLEPL